MTPLTGIVFVVDDDHSVRKAAVRLLRSAGWQVEAFATAEEFLDYSRPNLPSCLLLDVSMPGLTGIELQHRLRPHDSLPIVFMTGHGDIPLTVQAMKAGAADFLPKPVSDDKLLSAVHQAIASCVQERERAGELAEFRQRRRTLTLREQEVTKLVIRGLLNKQIANKLGITVATVKVHRGRAMEKLGLSSLADLVRLSERADTASSEKSLA